jgi:hypothetical protein
MTWQVYLAGEIHTDWREQIERGAADAGLDVEFTGPVTDRTTVRDAANGFEGRFVTTSAKMSWSASNANGFSFASDPIDTSHSVFAEIGEERNGRFFGGG